MAVWQADFSVEISTPWPEDYAACLDAVATRSRPLLPDSMTWGSEEGNRLDVHLERGRPAEGFLRLDLRNWDEELVEGILVLMRAWQARLIGPGERVVEPVLGDVALAARGSPAFRFVDDPELYFRRLRLGGLEDA